MKTGQPGRLRPTSTETFCPFGSIQSHQIGPVQTQSNLFADKSGGSVLPPPASVPAQLDNFFPDRTASRHLRKLQPGRDSSGRLPGLPRIAPDSSSRSHPETRPIWTYLDLSGPIWAEKTIPLSAPAGERDRG